MPRVTLPPELVKQKVLNAGYVRFIDSMGTDESVVESARLSTGRGFVSWDPYERCTACSVAWKVPTATPHAEFLTPLPSPTDCGPLAHKGPIEKFPRGDLGFIEALYSGRYLTEPSHIGPFEFGELVVEQQHPILVERQFARHRTLIALFSLNEFSARYAVLPDLFYVPSRERLHAAAQDARNKQGSAPGLTEPTVERITDSILKCNAFAREVYEGLVGLGLARELARGVLGVFQYTKLRRKANLRAWLGAAELRLDLHAQWEAQAAMNPIKVLLDALWPRTWALFEEYTLGAVRFSKTEITALRALIKANPWDGPNVEAHGYGLTDKAKRAAFLKKLGLEG